MMLIEALSTDLDRGAELPEGGPQRGAALFRAAQRVTTVCRQVLHARHHLFHAW